MPVECNYLLPVLVLKNENIYTSIKNTSVKHHTVTCNRPGTHQLDFHKSKLFGSGMIEFFENELTEQ